jgi:hypothetical protein
MVSILTTQRRTSGFHNKTFLNVKQLIGWPKFTGKLVIMWLDLFIKEINVHIWKIKCSCYKSDWGKGLKVSAEAVVQQAENVLVNFPNKRQNIAPQW